MRTGVKSPIPRRTDEHIAFSDPTDLREQVTFASGNEISGIYNRFKLMTGRMNEREVIDCTAFDRCLCRPKSADQPKIHA